jgi:divalent metal cation (Fe/Co/Zn/Cd) transporter
LALPYDIAYRIKSIVPKKFEITSKKRVLHSPFVGFIGRHFLNLITHHKPETTLWGIIISLVSIIIMFWLMNAKKSIGKKLHSEPIVADANCTKVCVYMSLVLLISSLIYELTGFAYADAIGTAGLIYFSISEGK